MHDGSAKWLSRLHARVYRLTSGRIGRRLVHNDMLLLTTTGRASGSGHTVPLLYLRDGDDLVVIASWGGRDTHPLWYLNLIQQPRVDVQVDARRFTGRARSMTEPERSVWWQRAEAAYDGYTSYQTKTTRTIPVVRIVALEDSQRRGG